MKKRFLSFSLICGAILALFIGGGRVYAEDGAEQTTIMLSPMAQRVILKPGEAYRTSVSVSAPANATRDIHYSAAVGSFQPTKTEGGVDDYGGSDLVSRSNYNQIVDWITIENDKGVVAPNGTTDINFVINVPKNAPAGGQYATIVVQNDTGSGTAVVGSNVGIQDVIEIGSVLFAEVSGETIKKGAITENNLPTFLLSGPVEATSMVRNEGNVHTDAKYTFQVWPLFSDEEICTNEEDAAESLILPGTERYHTETCNLPAVGIFRAKQTVRIFGDESVVEKTVVVCPLWLMVVVLLVVLAVFAWLVMRVRSRKKKEA